jgi:predicted NUDIX family NTP pyrophosphohydrolase
VRRQSAGILVYRFQNDVLEVFLVHPGGPLWAKKDSGAWSIPKGEFEEEDPFTAAKREFEEEIGKPIEGEAIALTPRTLKGGKSVYAWAVEGAVDPAGVRSNQFEMEWPPRSGRRQSYPEIDRAAWFPVGEALEKINPAQAGFIEELVEKLSAGGNR